MTNTFRKISRVGGLSGSTTWYLSEDCLLAAKRQRYSVEYRRFYLRDLESIVVWPSRWWLLRLIAPGALLLGGASLWQWVDHITGATFGGVALVWIALELAFGPTAGARIRTTGASVDLPLVGRTRRARKVLAKIDAVVRTARGAVEQPAEASVTASVSATAEANGS